MVSSELYALKMLRIGYEAVDHLWVEVELANQRADAVKAKLREITLAKWQQEWGAADTG